MKITESKLRQMIRGVIKEFTSASAIGGGKPTDYESPDAKSKRASYDTHQKNYEKRIKQNLW